MYKAEGVGKRRLRACTLDGDEMGCIGWIRLFKTIYSITLAALHDNKLIIISLNSG